MVRLVGDDGWPKLVAVELAASYDNGFHKNYLARLLVESPTGKGRVTLNCALRPSDSSRRIR